MLKESGISMRWCKQNQEVIARYVLLEICRKLSRKKLAKALNVSLPCISRWISGQRKMSLEHAVKIAEIMGDWSLVKKLYPNVTQIGNIIYNKKWHDELVGGKRINIEAVKQTTRLLKLPSSCVVPEINKGSIFFVIVDRYYNLLAFPEHLQAYKAAGHTEVSVLVVDVEQHLKDKTLIKPIIEHCSLSKKFIAALILENLYAKARDGTIKNKKNMEDPPEFKIYNIDEIIRCVGLRSYKEFQIIAHVLSKGCADLIDLMDKRDKKEKETLTLSIIGEIAEQPHNRQHELIALDEKALNDGLKKIRLAKKNKTIKTDVKLELVIIMGNNHKSAQNFFDTLARMNRSFSYIKQDKRYALTLVDTD